MPQPLQVLLVEDNPQDAELVLAALERDGFAPTWHRVETEADFLSRLHAGLDLVLSDYSLPQFSGLRALELVRKHQPQLPFIIVSGTIGEETAVEAMRLGATDYLLKDRLARLGQAINRAIAESRRDRDRRHTEAALRRSEDNLARAQGIAHIGSWDLDLSDLQNLNANPLTWSDELFRIFGCEPGQVEVTNDYFFRAVHPDDREKIQLAVAESLRTGQTYSIDHRIRLPDGTERVVHEQANIVKDATGRPVRMVGTTQDITERWRTAEALRASEVLYRTLFEYAPDGIVIADQQSYYLDANASVCRMLGYTREEFIGLHASDIVIPAETPNIATALDELKTKAEHHREWQFRRKDGSTFAAEVMATAMPDGNLMGMIRDITERKEATARLQESEERFRQMIANGSDIIALIDTRGVIRFQSPSTERILGHTPESMVGGRIEDFIHPEDLPKVREAIQRALGGRERPTPVEYRCRHLDGGWRTLQSFGKVMQGAANEPLMVVNSRDVTESRALEEQLRQSQKMEAIGQLSGGVAHDFNNLLTVIKGHIGLLRAKGQVSSEISGAIQQIDDAANRAANLTRQLLTFSRQQEMEVADLNLTGVAMNMVKMLRRLLTENIEMVVNGADQPLPIRADEGMVEQVLLNLVVNARDAMPRGGRLVISTEAVDLDEEAAHPARPGAFACLVVRDTGTGIAPDVLRRIFEPFFTTKGPGKGTGLGLATVYGVMQQHNGWVTVGSVMGQGTVFRAYFPRQAITLPAGAPGTIAAKLQGGHEGVLLVEDEVTVREIAQAALTGLGYRVFVATNGREALQLWDGHRHEIDLVLTDLVMPEGITGRDLGERLHDSEPSLPILYMSGYSYDVAGQDLALKEGTNYLPKPFDLASLARIVREMLDRAAAKSASPGRP